MEEVSKRDYDEESIKDKVDKIWQETGERYTWEKTKESFRLSTAKNYQDLYSQGKITIQNIKDKFWDMEFNGNKVKDQITSDNITKILQKKYEKWWIENVIMNWLMNFWIDKWNKYSKLLSKKNNKFSEFTDKQNAVNILINKWVEKKSINNYLDKLDEEWFKKLKLLNDEEFISFMSQEVKNVKIIEEKLSNNTTFTIEQLSNCVRVSKFNEDFNKNLSSIKSKHPQLAVEIEKFSVTDEELNKEYGGKEGELLKAYWSKEIARETLRNEILSRKIRQSEVYKSNPEVFKEFDKLVVEHYEFMVSLNLDINLDEIFWTWIKDFVAGYYTSLEDKTDKSFNTENVVNVLKKNDNIEKFLSSDDERYNISKETFNSYGKEFLESKMKSDPNYLQNIYEKNMPKDQLKKYPKFNSYFDKDLKLKSEYQSDKELKEIEKKVQNNVNYFLEDKRFTTNNTIKNYALTKSIEILKKNMNIDIDVNNTENLLKNFEVGANWIDVWANMDLAIKWSYISEWKKIEINIWYNLDTWDVSYEPLMYRGDNENSKIISMNSDKKTKIFWVKMPSLQDFKNVDLKNALNGDENNYEKNLNLTLNNFSTQYETKNSYFEKAMLENMMTQEMFLSLLPKNKQNSFDFTKKIDIDPAKQPSYHKLLSMIYDTTKFSTWEELKDLRDTNKKIDSRKEEIYTKTSSQSYVLNESNRNEEKIFFERLFNFERQKTDWLDLEKNSWLDNESDSNLLFYSCFTKEVWNYKLIDLPALKDFLSLKEKDDNYNTKDHDWEWKLKKNYYEESKKTLSKSEDLIAANRLVSKEELAKIRDTA